MLGAGLVNQLRLAAALKPPELRESQEDPPQGDADHEVVAQRDDVRELEHFVALALVATGLIERLPLPYSLQLASAIHMYTATP